MTQEWRIDYNNDTGPGDEGFWEWWIVTDGVRSFKADKEADAKWLRDQLAALRAAPTPPAAQPADLVALVQRWQKAVVKHGTAGYDAAIAADDALLAWMPAAPPVPLTWEQQVTAFVERCDEIRHGSPNAFYDHVDKFCKAWSALASPVGETPAPEGN